MQQLKKQEANEQPDLQLLFELLSHSESNYGFYAVSRISVIASLLGKQKTMSLLVPPLKGYLANLKFKPDDKKTSYNQSSIASNHSHDSIESEQETIQLLQQAIEKLQK